MCYFYGHYLTLHATTTLRYVCYFLWYYKVETCAISFCNINTSADVLTYRSKDVQHFKDCIGAIDGTHVLATSPPQDYVRYIGTSGSANQNVMAMVDFDMRFTYASIGQPGSMHDTSVLYHAIEHDKDTFPHPPHGKFSSTNSYISLIHCICYFLCVSIFRKILCC